MDNSGSQISAGENHSVIDGGEGSKSIVGLGRQATQRAFSAFGARGAGENGEVYGIAGG